MSGLECIVSVLEARVWVQLSRSSELLLKDLLSAPYLPVSVCKVCSQRSALIPALDKNCTTKYATKHCNLPGPIFQCQIFQGSICRGPICRGPIFRNPICHEEIGLRGPICRGLICNRRQHRQKGRSRSRAGGSRGKLSRSKRGSREGRGEKRRRDQ